MQNHTVRKRIVQYVAFAVVFNKIMYDEFPEDGFVGDACGFCNQWRFIQVALRTGYNPEIGFLTIGVGYGL